MKRKYFGTDGIRGEANKDLNISLVTKLGLALGYYLKEKVKNDNRKPRIVMGTDTRISGYMIRSALSAGLTAMGVNIDFVGVLPTPAVCYLTRVKDVDAGIMISASHNPIKDNGIKIFNSEGYKLSDDIELLIEEYIDNIESIENKVAISEAMGRFAFSEDYLKMYRNFLKSTTKTSFKGYKIVIDTGNGAAYRVATKVFQALGAEVIVINNIPNGKNINVNCGSTHPELLQEMVKLYNADCGLAYDGDADRLIAVDEKGNIVNGDLVIAIIGLNLKEKGLLNENTIVTTVLSNLGFEEYLLSKGIKLVRANVGDRYVLEKMKRLSLNLGGEQSGHIILSDYNTTGDGVLSSIQLVSSIIESGKKLSDLTKEISLWPQKMENIYVKKEDKLKYKENKVIQSTIKEAEEALSSIGRVIVRESGTENLIRVMIEAKDEDKLNYYLDKICDSIRKELNNA